MNALAVLTLAAVGAASPTFLPDPAEPTVVEFRLGRSEARTFPAWQRDGTLLLPVGAILDLAEIRWERTAKGLEAVMQPGNRVSRLDLVRGRIQIRDSAHALPVEYHLEDSDDIYVVPSVLALLLGTRLAVDFADLAVTVVDPSSLPVARRRARTAARRYMGMPDLLRFPDALVSAPRRSLGGAVLDYSVLSSADAGHMNSAFGAGLGLEVLGGALDARASTRQGDRTRLDLGWTGVWRDQPWLRSLRLGDGHTMGPHARGVRGIALTNAPWVRPAVLGSLPFGGVLEPGWEVEAYRGGRLVGFAETDATGRYTLDAPLQYGENPLRFVAYGPFGQVREFSRTLRIPDAQVGRRTFEYGLSAGACRSPVCDATANLDLKYGISERWVVGAGVDRFWRDESRDLTHPYAMIAGHVRDAWFVQAEAIGQAAARLVTSYEPNTEVRVSAEHTRFARNVAAPILTPAGREEQWTLDGSWRPGSTSRVSVDALLDLARGPSTHELTGRLGAALHGGFGQVLPSVRYQRTSLGGVESDRVTFGLFAVAPPRPRGNLLGAFGWHGGFDAEPGRGLSSASLQAVRLLGRGTQGQVGIQWYRDQGARLVFTFSSLLTHVRAYASTATSTGGTSVSSVVQGAVVTRPGDGQVMLSAGPALQRGGVSGTVFLDRNANGIEDAGDTPLAGVRVQVGIQTAVTDARGRFLVWDLTPYELVMLAVDTLSLESPLWLPEARVVAVEPAPHGTTHVGLAVLPGGVVEGRVVSPAGGVAGLRVVARHAASGDERHFVTFSDGGFYGMGLRPGRWEVTVTQRGVRADPLTFELAADPDGSSVTGLELVIEREAR